MPSLRRLLVALIVLLSAPLGAQIHSVAPPAAQIDAQEARDDGVGEGESHGGGPF